MVKSAAGQPHVEERLVQPCRCGLGVDINLAVRKPALLPRKAKVPGGVWIGLRMQARRGLEEAGIP